MHGIVAICSASFSGNSTAVVRVVSAIAVPRMFFSARSMVVLVVVAVL